jgi:hypothetical protein
MFNRLFLYLLNIIEIILYFKILPLPSPNYLPIISQLFPLCDKSNIIKGIKIFYLNFYRVLLIKILIPIQILINSKGGNKNKSPYPMESIRLKIYNILVVNEKLFVNIHSKHSLCK